MLRPIKRRIELHNPVHRVRRRGRTVPNMSGSDHLRRSERRWAPRYNYRTDLQIEWGSAVLRARTRDISSNGMFIESADPLWVGAGFTAHIGVEMPVKVDCFVKRVEPGLGMGVSVVVPEGQQEKFQHLLSQVSTKRG
jgi:hypothetical protein